MRILLQFPEGLKKYALKEAEKFKAKGHEVFISSSPSFGGCDLAVEEAKMLKVDKIVHYGHAEFVRNPPVKVEYIEWHINISIDWHDLVNHLKKEGVRTIALGTTVQHIHQINEMKDFFESNGFKVNFKKGIKAKYPGQVLGCDAKAVDVEGDVVVFVGDGMFHALAIDEERDVYVVNPYSGKFKKINDDIMKLRKRRRGSIIKAVDASIFGILVSTKIGQFNIGLANHLKKEIEKRQRKAFILVANTFEPLTLQNFMEFDAYVNTACPRIVDDVEAFGKPILNPDMILEVFKIWDELEK